MQVVKRQHYVSEGILDAFCNDSGHLFEALLMEDKIYGTSPPNAMCETYTYEHEKLDINLLENNFSTLESSVIPRLRNLSKSIPAIKKENDLALIFEEICTLLPSLLVFYYRSNALLQEYSYGEKEYRIPVLLSKLNNNEYIFRLAKTIVDHYNFSLITSKESFAISDQYISTAALKIKAESLEYSNRHMGLKDTLILIPISKKFYAVFWHATEREPFAANQINVLDSERTKLVNRTIICNSYSKCVAENHDLLATLLPLWKFKSPTQIFVGHTEKISSGFAKKKEVFYYDNDDKAYEVLTDHINVRKYMEAKGSDKCPCRSGGLFKNCHLRYVKIARTAYENIGNRYYMNDKVLDLPRNIEQPIDSWGPMSERYR